MPVNGAIWINWKRDLFNEFGVEVIFNVSHAAWLDLTQYHSIYGPIECEKLMSVMNVGQCKQKLISEQYFHLNQMCK